MCEENVKDLNIAIETLIFHQQELEKHGDTYSKLNDCFISTRSQPSDGTIEVPLGCTIKVGIPDGRTHIDSHASDIDDFAAPFHCCRNPQHVDKPK